MKQDSTYIGMRHNDVRTTFCWDQYRYIRIQSYVGSADKSQVHVLYVVYVCLYY